MKNKLKHLVLPIVAIAGMATHVQAAQKETPPAPAQTREASDLKYISLEEAFAGKSFDERCLAEELISQKDWLYRDKENKTKLKTSFLSIDQLDEEKLLRAGYQTNGETREEIIRLVLTGHKHLDTSLSYQEQLDACGFDMLSDIANGKIDSSKLSEEEFDRLRTQYMYAQWSIEKDSHYEQENIQLGNKVFPEQEPMNHVQRLTQEEVDALPKMQKTVINGHDVSGSPYGERIAKQAQKILSSNTQTRTPFVMYEGHDLW